jgi:hypothetical protein
MPRKLKERPLGYDVNAADGALSFKAPDRPRWPCGAIISKQRLERLAMPMVEQLTKAELRMVPLLQDPDAEVRRQTVEALGKIEVERIKLRHTRIKHKHAASKQKKQEEKKKFGLLD